MKPWAAFSLLALAALLVAAAFRFAELDRRPMHNDEAVNAVKFGQLWSGGGYRYDPDEYHGPTLHYLTAAWCRLTGAPGYRELDETRLRQVTALAGVLLVGAVLLWRPRLGPMAVLVAAWLTALSPVMVFYSRYWIHEPLLVLFTFLTIAGAWRLARKPSWPMAVLTGLAAGLMAATKETFVLNVAATAAGLVAIWAGERRSPREGQRQLTGGHWLIAAGVAMVTAALFFTSFGAHPAALLDPIRTYAPWLGRAGGASPHVNPWWFFGERLLWFQRGNGPVWSELFILVLALPGAAVAFRPAWSRDSEVRLVRFLLGYTVSLSLLYSLIPYKTPWCALGFWHGWILLAGVGAGGLWQAARRWWGKAGVMLFLLAGLLHLGWQAQRQNWAYPASRANPWVYAHTADDLANLVDLVREVARAGEGPKTLIQVVARDGDYWPLPWSLRAFERTGWWDANGELPDLARTPIIIHSAGLKLPGVSENTHVHAGYFQLRPRVFLEVHIERGLWERHVRP